MQLLLIWAADSCLHELELQTRLLSPYTSLYSPRNNSSCLTFFFQSPLDPAAGLDFLLFFPSKFQKELNWHLINFAVYLHKEKNNCKQSCGTCSTLRESCKNFVFQGGGNLLSISKAFKTWMSLPRIPSAQQQPYSVVSDQHRANSHACVKKFCDLCLDETKVELKAFFKTLNIGKFKRGGYWEQWIFWKKAVLHGISCSRPLLICPCRRRQFQTQRWIFTNGPEIFDIELKHKICFNLIRSLKCVH